MSRVNYQFLSFFQYFFDARAMRKAWQLLATALMIIGCVGGLPPPSRAAAAIETDASASDPAQPSQSLSYIQPRRGFWRQSAPFDEQAAEGRNLAIDYIDENDVGKVCMAYLYNRFLETRLKKSIGTAGCAVLVSTGALAAAGATFGAVAVPSLLAVASTPILNCEG